MSGSDTWVGPRSPGAETSSRRKRALLSGDLPIDDYLDWLSGYSHTPENLEQYRRTRNVPHEDVQQIKYWLTHASRRAAGDQVGDRVELHPGLDAWMQGDRYGEVAKVTPTHVHVKMDRSGPPTRSAHWRSTPACKNSQRQAWQLSI
ncbi:MAG TPA: hypothetical protein VEF72_03760 [Mycobacterium sp.]|nr:hypothetical protein [Mycobacterium sp.]